MVFSRLRQSVALFICPELASRRDPARPGPGFFDVQAARDHARARRGQLATGHEAARPSTIEESLNLFDQAHQFESGLPVTGLVGGGDLAAQEAEGFPSAARHEEIERGQLGEDQGAQGAVGRPKRSDLGLNVPGHDAPPHAAHGEPAPGASGAQALQGSDPA